MKPSYVALAFSHYSDMTNDKRFESTVFKHSKSFIVVQEYELQKRVCNTENSVRCAGYIHWSKCIILSEAKLSS